MGKAHIKISYYYIIIIIFENVTEQMNNNDFYQFDVSHDQLYPCF